MTFTFLKNTSCCFPIRLHTLGIRDTSDLLLLLYRLDDRFKQRELLDFLDALYKEYISDVSALLSELRKRSSHINTDPKYRKKGALKKSLLDLINKLNKHDFSELFDLKQVLEKDSSFKPILSKYASVFELTTTTSTEVSFPKKIRSIEAKIKAGKCYRMLA